MPFRVHNYFNPWQNPKSFWIQIEHGQRWKLNNLLWSKISKTRKWKLVDTSYFASRNESKRWNSNSWRKAIIFPVESWARADSQFSPEEWVRLVRFVSYWELLRDQGELPGERSGESTIDSWIWYAAYLIIQNRVRRTCKELFPC